MARTARRNRRRRGFTLVEVCIGVAIMALIVGVVVQGANNVSRAALRKSASALGAIIRQTYDDAALTGRTHRLLMVPGKGELKIESTADMMTFDATAGAFVTSVDELSDSLLGDPNEHVKDSKKGSKGKDAAPAPEEGAGGMFAALTGAKNRGQHAAKAGFVSAGKVSLDEHVHILDVWTDGLQQVVTQGEAYLFFFPSGYTQEAFIHLEDDDKRVFTVKVQPLTGRVEVIDSYVEAPGSK